MIRYTTGPHKNCIGYLEEKLPVGRPGPATQPNVQFHIACNFTFIAVGTVHSARLCAGEKDPNCGWKLQIYSEDGQEHSLHFRAINATSKACIAREFSQRIVGAICNLPSSQFLKFVRQDSCSENFRQFHCVKECGALEGSDLWVFADKCIDGQGNETSSDSFLDVENAKIRINAPICCTQHKSRTVLRDLLLSVRDCYGKSAMHAMHALTMSWKALHRQKILQSEHQMAIANITGPPNIGKSLISSVAAALIGCSDLVLSKATQSSMLDHAHFTRSLLVVWDDPRDMNAKAMEAIVHEAFHGLASTTIKHGMRRYNSSLLVGTQHSNLGIKSLDQATKSRISHISMQGCDQLTDAVKSLQKLMPRASHAFTCLQCASFEPQKVAACYDSLKQKHPFIMQRCLKTLALDIHALRVISSLSEAYSFAEINKYCAEQIAFLSEHCSVINAWDTFVAKIDDNSRGVRFNVIANKDKSKYRCTAYHLPAILKEMEKQGIKHPPELDVRNAAQRHPSLLFMAHNVNFKGKINRAICMVN